MKLKSSRRAAALLGTALAVSSLPLLSLSTSATAAETPGTTTFTKTLNYKCDVTVPLGEDELVFDDQPVTAKVTFALPPLTQRLQKIAPVDIGVDLTLPDELRSSAKSFLGAVAASGESVDTKLTLSQYNDPTNIRYYRIPKLSAEKTAIPDDGNAWVIPASGMSPAIVGPGGNSITTTIGGPSQFDIDSTLYKEDDSTLSVPISCESVGSRSIATVTIGEDPTMSAAVTPKVVKVRQSGAVVNVKVGSSKSIDGRIVVYKEGGKPFDNKGQLANVAIEPKDDGEVTVPLPTFGVRGKRTLTVVFEGDLTTNFKAVKTSFTVK